MAASRRGTPRLIMIGSTSEPTMMIAPRPVSDVKRTAVTAISPAATTIGRSPPNSAARRMTSSAIPVAIITRPSMAPAHTAT